MTDFQNFLSENSQALCIFQYGFLPVRAAFFFRRSTELVQNELLQAIMAPNGSVLPELVLMKNVVSVF